MYPRCKQQQQPQQQSQQQQVDMQALQEPGQQAKALAAGALGCDWVNGVNEHPGDCFDPRTL
jgi:hypothetical protein